MNATMLRELEAIGRVMGGLAHDFNNVLSVILTYSSLLETEAPDEWREDLAMIRKAALHGADLTKQLLALAQQHVVKKRTLDLGAIVAEMEPRLRQAIGEHRRLSIQAAPDLRPVRADATSIEQVILSMVLHARHSIPEGGTLAIQIANRELPHPHVELSIGGVTIPFPVQTEEEPEEPEEPALPISGDETVLLVDDDTSVRSAAAVILRRRGHRVLEAANPGDAIALSDRHRGAIHLLLTDVVMPTISGYQLAMHLTLARPDLRVLYMSGYAILEGTVPYIQKPFTPESLVASVRTVLSG